MVGESLEQKSLRPSLRPVILNIKGGYTIKRMQ